MDRAVRVRLVAAEVALFLACTASVYASLGPLWEQFPGGDPLRLLPMALATAIALYWLLGLDWTDTSFPAAAGTVLLVGGLAYLGAALFVAAFLEMQYICLLVDDSNPWVVTYDIWSGRLSFHPCAGVPRRLWFTAGFLVLTATLWGAMYLDSNTVAEELARRI